MNGTEQQTQTPQAPPVQGQFQQQAYQAPKEEAFDPRRKSPVLATFLSAMPGLGQIYIGYYQRGFIHILVVAGCIMMLNMDAMYGFEPFLGTFIAFFWLYNMIDAGRRAALYNQAIKGVDKIELPEEFGTPSMRGSIFGGIILVVGSVIVMSNTLFDISLDWVADWWPVAPLVFGVYLITKAVMDRAKQAEEKREE